MHMKKVTLFQNERDADHVLFVWNRSLACFSEAKCASSLFKLGPDHAKFASLRNESTEYKHIST